MAITRVAAGSTAAGTTSLSIPYPAGISAGDLLVTLIANKHPPNGPSTPTDWTLQVQGQGGSGSSGGDSGLLYGTIFTKVADGTESGNLSVTITSASCAVGVMIAYSYSGTLEFGTATADDTGTSSTLINFAYTSDPGTEAGDVLLQVWGMRSDGANPTSYTISQTGVTFDTLDVFAGVGTTLGNDLWFSAIEVFADTGTSSDSPVSQATSATLTGASGVGVMLRIREVSAGDLIEPDSVVNTPSVEQPSLTYALVTSVSANSVVNTASVEQPTVSSTLVTSVSPNSVVNTPSVEQPTVSSTTGTPTVVTESVVSTPIVSNPLVNSLVPVVDLPRGGWGPDHKKKKEEEETVLQTILRVISEQDPPPEVVEELPVRPTQKQLRKRRNAIATYEKEIIDLTIKLLEIQVSRATVSTVVKEQIRKIDLKKPVDDYLDSLQAEEDEALEVFQLLMEVA